VIDFHLLLRNRHVSRVVVGVPDGRQHIRARIETAGGDVITLQEATLAAIARAYLAVSTHPTRNAVELRAAEVPGRKDGFAEVQLIETSADEETLREELAAPPPEAAEPATEGAHRSRDARPILPARPGDISDVPPEPPHTAPSVAPVTHGAPATHHGAPDDDLELDLEDGEEDDGPVFGDVPTMHSRPPGEDS